MLLKEFLKLTPEERDIIYYWRILYCKQITADKISHDLKYPPEIIQATILKFNHNVRLKWEIIDAQRRAKDLIRSFFCD